MDDMDFLNWLHDVIVECYDIAPEVIIPVSAAKEVEQMYKDGLSFKDAALKIKEKLGDV